MPRRRFFNEKTGGPYATSIPGRQPGKPAGGPQKRRGRRILRRRGLQRPAWGGEFFRRRNGKGVGSMPPLQGQGVSHHEHPAYGPGAARGHGLCQVFVSGRGGRPDRMRYGADPGAPAGAARPAPPRQHPAGHRGYPWGQTIAKAGVFLRGAGPGNVPFIHCRHQAGGGSAPGGLCPRGPVHELFRRLFVFLYGGGAQRQPGHLRPAL